MLYVNKYILIISVLGTLQQYGWFILIGIAIIVYLYNRYRPQLEQWRDQREADSYKKMGLFFYVVWYLMSFKCWWSFTIIVKTK